MFSRRFTPPGHLGGFPSGPYHYILWRQRSWEDRHLPGCGLFPGGLNSEKTGAQTCIRSCPAHSEWTIPVGVRPGRVQAAAGPGGTRGNRRRVRCVRAGCLCRSRNSRTTQLHLRSPGTEHFRKAFRKCFSGPGPGIRSRHDTAHHRGAGEDPVHRLSPVGRRGLEHGTHPRRRPSRSDRAERDRGSRRGSGDRLFGIAQLIADGAPERLRDDTKRPDAHLRRSSGEDPHQGALHETCGRRRADPARRPHTQHTPYSSIRSVRMQR